MAKKKILTPTVLEKNSPNKERKMTEIISESGGRNIFIGTLNVIREPIRRRFEEHYEDKPHHFFIDIAFVIIILTLIIFNGLLWWDIRKLSNLVISEPLAHNPLADMTEAPNLKIETQVRYYAFGGEQIGRGPLPPKAGEKTNYWVFVKIVNQNNLIKNAQLVGQLSKKVEWTGRQSAVVGQDMEYDQTTGRFSWMIGDIQSLSEVIQPPIEGAFEAAIAPDVEDVGHVLGLIEEMYLKGEVNGKTFKKSFGHLTTDLVHDPKAKGMGRVQE